MTSRSVATEWLPDVVEQDAGEPEIAHRGPQLVGGEQRDERIAPAVARILVQLAHDRRRRTARIDRRDLELGAGTIELRGVLGCRCRRVRHWLGRLRRGLRRGLGFCSAAVCALDAATACWAFALAFDSSPERAPRRREHEQARRRRREARRARS